MEEGEQRERRHREAAEADRRRPRQGRGRNDHRSQYQQRERVVEAAGQVEQGGQLQDVVGEIEDGMVVGKMAAERAAQRQHHVQQRGGADRRRAMEDRQRVAEAVMHQQDRRRLAEHGRPADRDQRSEAQAPEHGLRAAFTVHGAVSTPVGARLYRIGGAEARGSVRAR